MGRASYLRTRGWGPWRQEWYSICSLHRRFKPDCKLCQAGHWVNCWRHAVGSLVFKLCPGLWQWWVNR